MTEIHIHANEPIIFVDGSYYVFHRYFATLRWYTFRNFTELSKEEQKEKIKDIHNDAEFVGAFIKHVEADMRKWRKHWAVPHGNIVFGFDCPRGDIWRNEHFPAYKQARVMSESFNTSIFPIFYAWFERSGASQGVSKLEHSRLEADDVIFLGVQRVLEQTGVPSVVVITNDNDYLQMHCDRVKIVNAQMVDIVARSSIGTSSQDLLMKVLMGDPSDNIPAVAAKVGPVSATKLALQGRDAVERWAEQKGCADKLRQNTLLVDFQSIPTTLADEFRQAHRWVFV